ncbi:RNA-dependent RNA polymerase [Erysiphe necator associated ourmia-like virus 89]|nr:RNA-dependent RNA polymerase [Erysiphe necator associated ourmia-like virus 89]
MRRTRWELALSVASIKRNLPASCRTHTPSARSAWELNASSTPPSLDPGYVQFARQTVTKLFPCGWDRRYDHFVGDHLPNPTARKAKSSRADLLWAGRREEFLRYCLEESTALDEPLSGRYKDVLSAGKNRGMLIFDERVDVLAPLHKMVFSHLANTTDWLLVGPPTAKRISSVCVNEIQTSVDLVSASDGLSHEVTKAILESLFFTSVKVPRSVRRLAYSSLSPYYTDSAGDVSRVGHGQSMGSYLCFPLLCLHSYVAASWASRNCGKARFLVNGDDCLVSSDRDRIVQDYPSGYRLNYTKTTVSKKVAELNSTVFLQAGGKWREVRHYRRVGASSDFPGMMHMAKAMSVDARGQDAFSRTRIGRRWGFLPSQLGHTSYASYKRERQLRVRRHFTVLPECPTQVSVPEGLRRVVGRDANAVEASLLKDWFWGHGRMGGLKRDVWSPSCGFIRRSYRYRAKPCISFLSFVGSRIRRLCASREKAPVFFLLPEEEDTEEEGVGLMLLDLWRQAFDSLAIK